MHAATDVCYVGLHVFPVYIKLKIQQLSSAAVVADRDVARIFYSKSAEMPLSVGGSRPHLIQSRLVVLLVDLTSEKNNNLIRFRH